MNRELPDVQPGFRKGRGTRDQIANIYWITEKQESSRKTSASFTKAFDCVDHNKLKKILKEIGIPDHLTCLLRNLCAAQEAIVRPGHGTAGWFQFGKEYIKAVYFHLTYLTYMQSTSCEVRDWMKHELESRLPGEISITSVTQMTPPL